MPSRSTIIPAIRRPTGGGDVVSHLRGISKQIQQFRRLNIPSRAGSGDTTVQLVQLYQLVCGVLSWCGVVPGVSLCPEYIQPAWLTKEIQFVCYQADLLAFLEQNLLSRHDEIRGRTEQNKFCNCFNKKGNIP